MSRCWSIRAGFSATTALFYINDKQKHTNNRLLMAPLPPLSSPCSLPLYLSLSLASPLRSPSCRIFEVVRTWSRPQPVSIRQKGSPRCRPASCAPNRTIQQPRKGSVDRWMRRAIGGRRDEREGRRRGGGGCLWLFFFYSQTFQKHC